MKPIETQCAARGLSLDSALRNEKHGAWLASSRFRAREGVMYATDGGLKKRARHRTSRFEALISGLARLAAGLVLVIGANSCRSSSVTDAIARDRSTDTVLESKLELLDPRTSGDGAARALTFTLRSAASEPLIFSYTVDWFDAGGRVVPLSSTAWHPLRIEAQSAVPVRVAAMPVEAVSWRLRFRSTASR